MDWFRVGETAESMKAYNVIVTSLEENFTILYGENTGRTLAKGAPMVLDALGTFFGHNVTVRRKSGYESEFDDLYRLISRPRNNGLQFDIVHYQDTANYEGYVSSGARALKRIDEKSGKVYWDEFSMTIVPMRAQVTIDDGQSANQIW